MKIEWSSKAEEDFDQNIDYLIREWSTRIANDFTNKTANTLKVLGRFPNMGSLGDYKDVRKTRITAQISLLYRVEENRILLLRFWNNYQNPDKLKL